MAIVIPSKNIYDKTNNIIRNNQIDKVEVSANNIETITDTENVYNENIIVTDENTETPALGLGQTDSEGKGSSSGSAHNPDFSIYSYVNLIPVYVNTSITIPKTKDNAFISSLLTGTDDNGNTNIQYSLYGDIITGTTGQNITIVTINALGTPTYVIDSFNIHYFPDTTENNVSYVLSEDKTNVTHSATYSQGLLSFTVTATVNFDGDDNIKTATAIDNGENYQITLKFLAGLTIIQADGSYNTWANQYPNETPYTLNGTYEQYVPKQINVSFYGITIAIDVTEDMIVVGNGKKSYSTSYNELMQSSNTYYNNIANTNENAVDKMGNNILNIYKNGLQTATILCSISDYYNEYGTKVISKDGSLSKMIFNAHDYVIPYVCNAAGIDIPMALNADGSPKEFMVTSTKLYYDGAVWQELTIKER